MPLLIALRRSWGLPALPLFLCLEIVTLMSRDRLWAIEWQWATSYTNGILVLLGPLAAGVATAEAAHARKHGGRLVVAMGSRGLVRAQAARSLAVGLWACVAQAIGQAATWVIVAARHREIGALEWRLVFAAFLLLLAFAFLGGAVGWLIPSLLTAPIVAALGYFVPAMSLASPHLFLVGGSTGPGAGSEYRADILVAQALAWIAVGITTTVAVLHRTWIGRALVVTGVALVVLAAGSLGRLGPDATRPRPVTEFACAGSAPEVCAPADYRELVPRIQSVARPVVISLSKALGRLPVERLTAFAPGSAAPGSAEIPVYLEPPFTDELNVALSVVRAALSCPAGAMLDHDVSLIVAGAVPRLRGWAAGAAGIDPASVPDPAGARSRFEALADRCAS
ncbi:hypothetical protein GCM10027053_20770 [Intrasporangium mesophilum]